MGQHRLKSFGHVMAYSILGYPTDYTPDLIHAAVHLLERIYRPGFHYQKCGVMLMDLSPAAYHRRDLFDTRDQARQVRLMRARDRLTL